MLAQHADLVDACSTGVVTMPATRFAKGLELIKQYQKYAPEELNGELAKVAEILKRRATAEGNLVKLNFQESATE